MLLVFLIVEQAKREMVIINKERFIGLRVTKTEYRQIERKAKKAKMNMSQYVSLQALERDIFIFDDLKEHTHQLSKLGSNLNQALILSHQGKLTTIDLTTHYSLLIIGRKF